MSAYPADLQQGMDNLLGAVIDGRTDNIRYRQNELHRLHTSLGDKASLICAAITADISSTAVEAETEFFLAMDSIRKSYYTLDFDRSIKDEYLVTTGEDNPERSKGVGLVTIRPTSHSKFYSVVAPLAAAIAAGNCVLLEVSVSHFVKNKMEIK